jgi:putative solute:sodium symporter small subunit
MPMPRLPATGREEARAMRLTDRHRAHWRRNLRLTTVLLSVWFLLSFVTPWFARELNAFDFIGPLGFYLAAQGALIVYVLIVWYYAHRMNRLDEAFGVQEGGDD